MISLARKIDAADVVVGMTMRNREIVEIIDVPTEGSIVFVLSDGARDWAMPHWPVYVGK